MLLCERYLSDNDRLEPTLWQLAQKFILHNAGPSFERVLISIVSTMIAKSKPEFMSQSRTFSIESESQSKQKFVIFFNMLVLLVVYPSSEIKDEYKLLTNLYF